MRRIALIEVLAEFLSNIEERKTQRTEGFHPDESDIYNETILKIDRTLAIPASHNELNGAYCSALLSAKIQLSLNGQVDAAKIIDDYREEIIADWAGSRGPYVGRSIR
jgi:hypothetical protein